MGTEADGGRARLTIDVEENGATAATIRLLGELDLVTAPRLRRALDDLAGRRRRVVLDLSAVDFIDSTGLVLLMDSARDAGQADWALAMRRDVSPVVRRLLEVTRTESLFAWTD